MYVYIFLRNPNKHNDDSFAHLQEIKKTDTDLRVQCPGWSMHWSRSHKHWYYDPGPKAASTKSQYWKTDECPVGYAYEKGKGYFHILDPKNLSSTPPPRSTKKRSIHSVVSNTTSSTKRSRIERDVIVVSLNDCVTESGALHVPKTAKISNLHGEILKFIRNGKIKFPFKSVYFNLQKRKMFENLQRMARDRDPKTYFRNERFAPFRVQFRHSSDMFPFTFTFGSSATPRFYLHMENENEYWDIQILTDLYSEERRLSARRNYQPRSVLEAFRSDEKFQSNIIREALVYQPKKRMERIYADISTRALMPHSSSSSTYRPLMLPTGPWHPHRALGFRPLCSARRLPGPRSPAARGVAWRGSGAGPMESRARAEPWPGRGQSSTSRRGTSRRISRPPRQRTWRCRGGGAACRCSAPRLEVCSPWRRRSLQPRRASAVPRPRVSQRKVSE